MAKTNRPEELRDEPRASSAPTSGIVELSDFDSTEMPLIAAQAVHTDDTIIPSADLFAAAAELERQLGGLEAMATSFASTGNETAGAENIVGIGVGLKSSDGTMSATPVVKVFVREKLPLRRVSSDAQIQPSIAGIDTDVEAIGDVIKFSYARRYDRPVPCGVSCSHINLPGSGTIGCLVVLDNNRLCILSNNHVLANENSATQGDSIIQPGNAEPSPAPDQVIARLERFVRIQATDNRVDGAVAWTSTSRVSPKHVTYTVNPSPVAAALGLTVMKNGRTTESTVGTVTDIGVTIRVGYTPYPQGAVFRNQIAVRGVSGPFSRPGDSAALIVTAGSKRPVALLFAGAGDNSITFGNVIGDVMSQLGIARIYGPE